MRELVTASLPPASKLHLTQLASPLGSCQSRQQRSHKPAQGRKAAYYLPLCYDEGMSETQNGKQGGRRWYSRGKPKPTAPKKPNNYAFIDSQNLNLGVQKIGWKMDWHKFRIWLAEKYGVTHAYMFIGYMPDNESLYQQMYDHGFLVVLKPTLEIKNVTQPDDAKDKNKQDDKEKPAIKGNIDADLVLYAMKELPRYDKAVIVSGDGDFFGLIEHLLEQKKLLKVLAPNRRYSTLLQEFEPYIEGIDQHRAELAYRDRRRTPRKKS